MKKYDLKKREKEVKAQTFVCVWLEVKSYHLSLFQLVLHSFLTTFIACVMKMYKLNGIVLVFLVAFLQIQWYSTILLGRKEAFSLILDEFCSYLSQIIPGIVLASMFLLLLASITWKLTKCQTLS